MSNLGRFIAELRRRKVFRTAGIYLIGAWVAIQVASETAEPLGLPAWTETFVVWAVVIGFPMTLLLGWRYELGPTGISLTKATTDEPVDLTLKRADYLILTLVALVIGVFAYGVVDRDSDVERDFVSVETVVGTAIEADMIAVLPFVIEGNRTEEDEIRARGLENELRNGLHGLPGIRVAGRRSSEAYRDSPEDAATIAASLGHSTLIEASTRSSDGNLSVSLEITDGPSGSHIWSGRFARPTDEIPALLNEMVTAVVAELAPGTATEPITDSDEALDYFFSARHLDQQARDSPVIDLETMIKAIENYFEAFDADPNMAEAYAHAVNALLFIDEPDVARNLMFKALDLDRDAAVVQHALASFLMKTRGRGIEEAYKAANAADPDNTEILLEYGAFLWNQADNIAPEGLFLRAIDLDRGAFFPYARLGELYGVNGRVEDALEVASRIEMWFPNATGYMEIASIHEQVGRLDEAIVWARRAKAAEPDRKDVDWQLAEFYARLGDIDMSYRYEPEKSVQKLFWQQNYEDLIDLVDNQWIDQQAELRAVYLAAFGHLVLGDPDAAVYFYETNVAEIEGEGMPRIAMHESRVPSSPEHLVHYAEALKEIGRDEDALAAARWVVAFMDRAFETGNTVDWWATTYQACALIVLGDTERALDLLPRIKGSPRLPQSPVLEDSPCFREVADDPRYIDVIRHVDSRIDEIRGRLPDTLRAHDLEP